MNDAALFCLSDTLKGCGRAAVVGTLCVLMAGQPLLAAEQAPVVRVAAKTGEIQGQERVLHALNRLTFGPRPGDVAAVEAMGLKDWFEAQLNPRGIGDAALEARLAQYPAMNLPLAELERKYPGPQELKQMIDGKMALPGDPLQRQMVEDQIAFYKQNRAKQAAAVTAQKTDSQAMNSGGADTGMSAAAAMAAAGKKKNQQAEVQAGMDALAADAPTAMAGGQMEADKPIAAGDLAMEPMVGAVAPAERAAARADVQRLVAMPPNERMQAMMALSPNQLTRLRQGGAAAQLTEGLTAEQKEMLVALPGGVRMVALEAMESRLTRDIYSERQLEAVMTDFWLNHFNVYVRKNQNEPYLLPAYERETIRPRALGNFEDLLVATAESPAMEVYLDNFRSVGPDSMAASRIKRAQQMRPNGKLIQKASAGLNENYGRELMELHTLGVNGGYTQADVTNVAKVFTGWGLDKPYQGGSFEFDERRHEPGSKLVLGKTIGEGGQREGLEVLHMLATSPATARFISSKLAVRFVSDAPPAALVDRMAASFLQSKGDIKTVLRTMFNSPEFWATETYRAKVKTPEEFVISAVRASGAEVANPQALVQSLDKLGMPLYGMQTPQGYSWMQEGWVSTGALVSRMNFALILTADRLPGVRIDWTGALAGKNAGIVPAAYTVPAPADVTLAKEKRLEMMLLGMPVSERTRATVIGQSGDQNVTDQAETQFDLGGGGGKKGGYAGKGLKLNGQAGADDPQAAVMAGLLLGSPEFQRR